MRRAATPLLVTSSPCAVEMLQRLTLDRSIVSGYNERWIQKLVDNAPSVLPIAEAEPAFWPLVPVCMELPLRSGYVDNLLVTPNGDLVVVECKLWRNVEARREVIAQIIDYAKSLQRLSYDAFEAAIQGARKDRTFRLYEHVVASSSKYENDIDETAFIDAVSRNLRRGRCLLAIVGDGITEEVEELTEFLQQHAGLHFVLLLVQLAVHRLPGHGTLVVPSIPVRTTNIIRGIVQILDGKPTVVGMQSECPQAGSLASVTLSEEEFFASLDKIRPGTSQRLFSFLKALQDLAIDWSIKKMMSVRLTVGGRRLPFLVIGRDGDAHTDYAMDAKSFTRPFIEMLAASIPGTKLIETPKTIALKRLDGLYPTIWDFLDHESSVKDALVELQQSMVAVEVSDGPDR